MLSRKEVLKMLSVLPLGLVANNESVRKNEISDPILSNDWKPSSRFGSEAFREIGVEPIINCRGTFTIIGGSIERPQVRMAMEAASQNYIQYDELAEGIGQKLAVLTGAEWGMVSAGCAAALKHATMACVTGGNPEKLIRIPNLNGFDKTVVIIPLHSRNAYDHAIRNVGVQVITVESQEELISSLSSRTAMIYLFAGRGGRGPLGLTAISKIAKSHKVPILVDAAAEDLTIPNAHLHNGATMVSYSGGKALRGPQCAGLLLGPKDLLMAAWQASSPHHGPGRDNKVGREEMMGMLAAVDAWVKTDHRAEWELWLSWLDHIRKKVSSINGIFTKIEEPTIPGMDHPGDPVPLSNHSPRLEIYWKPETLHLTGPELAEIIGRSKPRIAVGSGDDTDAGTTSINITAWMMQPGEDQIVADRIFKILLQKRSPKHARRESPAVKLIGRWKVDMEYFTSHSEHAFYFDLQDGNWVEGVHKGDFSVRNIAGTIEGNTVKLLSIEQMPGDQITNIFRGTLSEDKKSISGDIYLGEYLTAKFTATRQQHFEVRESIQIPGGPPLAT